MKLHQVALQLYTLRDFTKTPSDFAVTARKIRAAGYEAVQISGVGPIEDRELASICRGEGLRICATHESGKVIVEETQKIIDRLGRLGATYTAYPHPHVPLTTVEEVLALASDLDKAGKALRKAGQVLTYHNHAIELRKFDGKTMLDLFFEHTNKQNLQATIDTYWIQAGGGDPAEWCRKLKRRLPMIHMKDFGVSKDNKTGVMMEVGAGNLNWQAIIPAAEKSGCEWFIVEQDICPGDPFDSIRMSYQFIKEHLAEKSGR